MAFSKIVLTFNGDGSGNINVAENILFTITDVDTAIVTNSNEVCRTVRLAPGEFSWDDAIPNRFAVIQYYMDALNFDINATNLYDIFRGSEIITIQAKKNNVDFSAFSATAGVTAVITNEPFVPLFQIDTISFTEKVGDACNKVIVSVLCTEEVTDVTSPVVLSGNTGNTVSFDWVRGAIFKLDVNNGVSFDSDSVTTPSFLLEPTISVVNTPSGASATITSNLDLTLEYSLDNITYQATNVFPGLPVASYIGYVRDVYNCVKSTVFEVNEFTPELEITDPVTYISNTNSLRFKKEEIWDNLTIYKTDHNTLSCEEDVHLIYPYLQKYQSNDKIITQVKTNYENLVVKVIENNGTETIITTSKETENIGKKDKRDALLHAFSDGRHGFYFITGDTYDYDTDIQNGTYELYGALPDWAKIGQYFSLNNGPYYEIVDIEYVDSISAEVIVLDAIVPITASYIVNTIYNAFNWDAYEFEIDMNLFLDKLFHVEVEFTDSVFDTVKHISEVIQVSTLFESLLEVIYSNTENNDILYSTGIINKLRLEYDIFGLVSESETEIHKTDSHVYKLNSNLYAKKELVFVYLSTMMARKVMQAFSLNVITINGISYTTETIDQPSRIGITNWYNLTIKLYESKGQIETEAAGSSDIGLDIIDVPALVDSGDGFIEQ